MAKKSKKHKKSLKNKPIPLVPPQGEVRVTFDAGSGKIEVCPNPVEPMPFGEKDKCGRHKKGRIVWKLDTTAKNGNDKFGLRLGNVVLCDVNDEGRLAAGGKIKKKFRGGKARYEWEFDFPEPCSCGQCEEPEQIEVPYDIFCSYGLKEKAEKGKYRRHVLSLRESVGLDPTVLTPPGDG
jgi:hypothetical protein